MKASEIFEQISIRLVCYTLLPILLLLLQSGCATSTTIRVLDAVSKRPIEGAVAIAMWNKNRGFFGGFELTTYTAKAIEEVSDKEGYFTFPTVSGSYATTKPHVKVYKPGYVGWDSKHIYLGHHPNDKKRRYTKKRENFVMRDQEIFLEPWKEEYTYISHSGFIRVKANLRKEAGISSSIYNKAIRYETPFIIKERKLQENE